MKKILSLFAATMAALAFTACSSDSDDGGGNNNGSGDFSVNLTKLIASGSNINGANALAVAAKSNTRSTRATETITSYNQLYKVSNDMKFISVEYTFDTELTVEAQDENGKAILDADGNPITLETVKKQIQQNLKIKPNFIFNIGEDYLWLANCYYTGWENMEESPVKKALNTMGEAFNQEHRSTHGVQYIIRKSDGAFFQWDIANGAPSELGDGYNPQSMLNGWFHAVGKSMFVRTGGYNTNNNTSDFTGGGVYRITDKGSSLNYEKLIESTYQGLVVNRILPADENHLGVVCRDQQGYPVPYIYNITTRQMNKLSNIDVDNMTRWSIISIAGKLYAVRIHHRGEDSGDTNYIGFYEVNTDNAQVDRTREIGSKTDFWDGFASFNDDKFFAVGYATTDNVFRFIWNDDGQNPPVRKLYSFDFNTQNFDIVDLPSFFPGSINAYIEGVGVGDVTKDGFKVCNLDTRNYETVSLDWSNASQYQSYPREYVHFEAANMSIKYEAKTGDGKLVAALWVPVTGPDKGKVKVITDENGNADIDVKVVVDLNK